MKRKPDIYDRLNARLRMITRIAEMGREAARMPAETPRGRRAWARIDALMARLEAMPPVTSE